MRLSGQDHSRTPPWALWLAAGLVPMLLLIFWLDPMGVRQDLTMAALSMQRELHRDLAQAMRDTAADRAFAGWSLVSLSFLYGIFHAVGPGHGKVVIGTYLATQDQPMRRGLLLANLSALMQGVTAVIAVGATLWLFARTARDANATANQLELLSYGLVIAVGLYLCLRALRGLMRPEHAHCCHDHAPNPESAGFLATMISTGMRPCSGGILVLVLAAALDLWWYGAAGVLAMSAGTGLTVSVLAVIAVKARSTAGRIVSGMDQGERRLRTVMHLAALAGGVLIIAFGFSLIDSALTVADHPLMRG